MSTLKINRRWLKRTLFALVSGVSGVACAGAERVEFAGRCIICIAWIKWSRERWSCFGWERMGCRSRILRG